MTTVLVAPDSFKGTYSSAQVAEAIAAGLSASGITAIRMPVADGGEGTVEALRHSLALDIIEVAAVSPWRDPVPARYGFRSGDGPMAVVEVAAASGINTPSRHRRDPLTASTRGTGLQIADAVARGARHIVVGAGGSATTDGGRGCIGAIEEAGGLGDVRLTVLTDVGIRYRDAPRIFGPQKGATPEQIVELERTLESWAAELPRHPDLVDGGGAAGGLAGGLWARFDATLVSGAEYVLDQLGFDEWARTSDFLVVGEGCLDNQTAQGKIVSVLMKRFGPAKTFAVVGSLGDGADQLASELAGVIVASDLEAMRRAGEEIAARICR